MSESDIGDELAQLREEVAELRQIIDNLGGVQPVGSRPIVATTSKLGSTYPAGATVWFWCIRNEVGGTEAEGLPGTLSATEDGFFALNTSNVNPPMGSRVNCDFTGEHYTFYY